MKPVSATIAAHEREGADGHALDRDAGDHGGLFISADGVKVAAERRVLREHPDGERHRAEDQGGQRHAAELIGDEDEEEDDLRGEEELEESEFAVVGREAVRALAARGVAAERQTSAATTTAASA